MNTTELLKAFNKGERKGQASQGRIRIEGDYLMNYNTIIARRNEKGEIELNNRKYSMTTSKLQNKIRYYCDVKNEFYGDDATIYYWGW